MPKVGAVEFEKVSLTTPKDRLGALALDIDQAREREMAADEWNWRQNVEVHPSHTRRYEFAELTERFGLGQDVVGAIRAVIEDIKTDEKRGKYGSIIRLWFHFAVEHPEVISPGDVKALWKEAILLEERPVFRLDRYCEYLKDTGEVDAEQLGAIEEEAMSSLPKLEDINYAGGKGQSDTLEFLLRAMASMYRARVSTEKLEAYFEDLVVGVDLGMVDIWVLIELMDYLLIYHKSAPELVAETVKRMAMTRVEAGRLEDSEKGTLLQRVAEDLADLNFYDEAETLWKEALPLASYPSSENPSAMIGCAIRTGNEARMTPLFEFHRNIAVLYTIAEHPDWPHPSDSIGSAIEDVTRVWEDGLFLAIEFHLPTEFQIQYLESPEFLDALKRGVYDSFINDLITFCEAYPQLIKLRRGVEQRVGIGLNRINGGKLEDRKLDAARALRAAVSYQNLKEKLITGVGVRNL